MRISLPLVFGALAILSVSALAVFEIETNKQREECANMGGEYVRTGPSRYICMAKECLK